MGPRPAPLDLKKSANANGLPPPRYPDFTVDLPSPRAGEAPPALSPLDAFALHSRMLQRKFEEEAEQGRRLSRLPYHTVAQQLAIRPVYNIQQDINDGNMEGIAETQEESSPKTRGGAVARQNAAKDRPKSQYPMLGRIPTQGEDRAGTSFYDPTEEPMPQPAQEYFGVPRTASPDPTDPRVNIEAPSPNVPSLTSSIDSLSSSQAARAYPDRNSKISHNGLLPARSAYAPRSPRSMQSIRAVRQDSGDDDTASQSGISAHALSPRKFSGSSGMSQPQSPFTPNFMPYAHRSPSMTSEYSLNGFQPSPRPTMNFSRPDRPMSPEAIDLRSSFDSRRSFESRPSGDVLRHPSNTSTATHVSASSPPRSRNECRDEVPKPFANDNNASDSDADSNAGRTYTYSKFKLPRGRNIDRESSGFRTSWIERQFNWETDSRKPDVRPIEKVLAEPELYQRPTTAVPPTRSPLPLGHKTSDHLPTYSISRPVSPTSNMSSELRRGRERAFSSANRSHSADPRGNFARPKTSHTPSASIATDSTEHTMTQPQIDARKLTSEVTPEDHLEIGIQAHSAGQTNKSTYHLRLAAKAGLPTAMLLYALACRHGWGMRANQEEGVKWLQKAIDDTKLEEQDLDLTLSNASRRSGILDPAVEAAERKKRKAQFALAVYELGISYANGWGCTKDRSLALKCYEIAGRWGDCDALAEAGYCYTQGLGCKKDMHKAATLYRRAADGGMSMAGNSWIYKEKYNDTLETASVKDSNRRARSRSIWGRPKKEK